MKPHWSVLLIPTNFETKERATSFFQLNPLIDRPEEPNPAASAREIR
jgi:hypothetical protein